LRLAADNLIRTWLLKKHAPLLIDFLNGLGIAHENGVVGELPPTVEEAALINVIERLLAQYPPAVVSVYLHAFNSMNEAGWTNLDALLARDPRLTLQPAPAACPAHGQRCPG
ncbi:MAG TPA: hypothetical protein VNO52_01550, partial [Methylomirabilota bacterium]|nr:hypothetical protein [Methylomirabilota bacterium]